MGTVFGVLAAGADAARDPVRFSSAAYASSENRSPVPMSASMKIIGLSRLPVAMGMQGKRPVNPS